MVKLKQTKIVFFVVQVCTSRKDFACGTHASRAVGLHLHATINPPKYSIENPILIIIKAMTVRKVLIVTKA